MGFMGSPAKIVEEGYKFLFNYLSKQKILLEKKAKKKNELRFKLRSMLR
jgi:hypothetical protein